MVHKYFKGTVPKSDGARKSSLDLDIKRDASKTVEEYEKAMEDFAFHKALMALWEFINRINKYIDITAPWELAKKKAQHKELGLVLYNILEGLRMIAGLVYPFMPTTAQVMEKHLGMTGADNFQRLEDLKAWGKTMPGTKLPRTVTLFPRVDLDGLETRGRQTVPVKEGPPSEKPEIAMKIFQQVDLRVATVLDAEPIPRSQKLLKLKVDAGEERTIVAGIAESYQPEDLLGKQVVIVANLKPAKLMGVLSQGVLLTAADETTCALVTLDGPCEPGTPLA
jgi:methionyl-tRNA synthetase